MHRSPSALRLRSIGHSFWKFKASEYNFSGKFEVLRTFTTLNGNHAFSGYVREPITSSMQSQIVNALQLGNRSRASSLLFELGCTNQSLRAEDFVYILKYCARSPDPLFVMETWRFMEEKEIVINGKCYFLITRALCKGGYLKEAFNFVSVIGENHDSYPILPVYNNFLGACARVHSVYYANECLTLMERQLVGKNESTYAELLKLAVLQQNLSAVHEIWKECTKFYSLSIICLRKFVWSFTRLRDMESAYEALKKMVDLAFRGGYIIGRTAESKMCISRLDIPIPFNSGFDLKRHSKEYTISATSLPQNCKEMDSCTTYTEFVTGKEVRSVGRNMVRQHISVPTMKVLRWSFNDVIHACVQTQDCKLAEHLILQMQNLGLEPSRNTYDALIRVVVSTRSFHDGIEVLKLMQFKNMKPHDSTFAAISMSCSRALELDLAEAFLNQISESPCAYPYNALLEACDIVDQPERAVRVLAKMKQLKLHPDIRTYELLFSLFGNVNAPYEEGIMLSQVDAAKRINAIEVDMVKNDIQHSHLSLKNLLKALGTEGMIRDLLEYLWKAESQLSHSNTFFGTPIYNTVLHSLVEAKESNMAIDIFKTMKLHGFPPDAATYNIMIDCCSILGCFKSASALVSMMIRDGFFPQAVTYTALIKILLGFEDFDEALNLLDRGSSEGIRPDTLLFNTILQEACTKERIDMIELVVERMHQEKVQPDASTCSHVFSAYVNQGFFTTAMEALQVLSMRMISLEDDTLEEERLKLEEDFVLAEDTEAEQRILQFFRDSSENIAVALLNLRMCALSGYPILWSSNQSQWAKRLATIYSS